MNRNRIPWLFRSLTAVGAVLFLLTLSLFTRPIGSSEEMIEVTVWTVTLPDGQVLKVNSVKGQDSPARFKHRSFPYWLTLKAGAIDHAIGTATFELARSTGSDSSSKITQVITSQPSSLRAFHKNFGFSRR
jgi:hypothetical protein